jgi:N-acetylmuramoyl-L-alanine amidase
MQTHQRFWRYLQQHRALTITLGHVCVLLVFATLFFGSSLGSHLLGVFAQSRCASGDQAYSVQHGDTLGSIAAHYNTSWQSLASYNHISNPNVIYINETICIPGKGNTASTGQPVRGKSNPFPYGECTWWAANRYHQLKDIYVPWTTQSNAYQWTARAQQFHWKVSSHPTYGAIVDLQPWVQGAYGLGHVAVVEKILSNGHVIASNMNWGAHYWEVVDVEFTPGPGVTFISF